MVGTGGTAGDDEREVLARLAPSPSRRLFALSVVYGLGVLLAALAVTGGRGAAASVVLLSFSVLMLWQAERLRRGTRRAVLLTTAGLSDDSGAVLAPLDEISRVDRGIFAFKPSNGFLVVLSAPRQRAWVPGLWWRLGRRIGVGGVTPAAEARLMADQLSLLLARRQAD